MLKRKVTECQVQKEYTVWYN